jgi:hypothetical protein
MDKTTIYESLGFVLAFLGIGIGYLAVHMGIRKERLKRELEHKERMRALELGRSLPGDTPWLSPVKLGLFLAVVMPIGIFGCACASTIEAGFHEDIWKAASIVGLGGVVCGTVLAAMSFSRADQPRHEADGSQKPVVADDAYDVVSARG